MLQVDSTTQPDSVKTAFGFDPRPLAGNIGYVSRIGLGTALKLIFLGRLQAIRHDGGHKD